MIKSEQHKTTTIYNNNSNISSEITPPTISSNNNNDTKSYLNNNSNNNRSNGTSSNTSNSSTATTNIINNFPTSSPSSVVNNNSSPVLLLTCSNNNHQQVTTSLPSPNSSSSNSTATANSPNSNHHASFFKRLLSNFTPNLSRHHNHLQLPSTSEKKEHATNQQHMSGSPKNTINNSNNSNNYNSNNNGVTSNGSNHGVELDLDGLSVMSVESTPSVDVSSSSFNHHQNNITLNNTNNNSNGSSNTTGAIVDIFPKPQQEEIEQPSMDHIISRKLAQKKKDNSSSPVVRPVNINAFTSNEPPPATNNSSHHQQQVVNNNEKVLTQNTVFHHHKDTPMPTTSTPSALLSGKISADLFANIEQKEKKKPKKKKQETGIRNVETSVKTRNKTYLKKMTFMQSLSTSGDQHPNSTKKGQQKQEQAPFENDLLFNDLQVFKNQVFKRYCKILEQPIFCKAFNYEVIGPKEFLTNPYIPNSLLMVEDSPAVSTSSSVSSSLSSPTLMQQQQQQKQQEEENPFLFDEKFVKEFKWRRRKMDKQHPTANSTQQQSMPNVPTVDIVCEDGATLSCYFEMVGQNDQPSISTRQEDQTNSNNSSTTSKKTLLLFHDGCEEAFEYFFQPSLRKFKDFIISMGLQIFIFEYRGFGFSTCAKGEDERSSLHRYLETDYKLIHHLFTTRLKIPMSQVVVYGKGFLGTTCAMHFVSNFPSVCGLCLESPCFDILKVVLGNLPENVLSYISSQGAEQNTVRPEDESIRFEFTKYNFGVEKYYRMPYPKSKKIMSAKQQNARPKTTIACKVGDEKYYNLKEVKNCISHHFDIYSKLSCFPGKLLILFQQGNELVPYCDVENFFKNIKTGEKNMYLLSSNELSAMNNNANDDPFNLFERKFFTCVRGIHKFMESVGHSFPDNFNQFMYKLFQLEQRLLEDQANQTSELSDLAASGSYVDTYESYGGRGRRNNPYLPICGGCNHCRACVDQSMIENEGTDNTDHDCDSEDVDSSSSGEDNNN